MEVFWGGLGRVTHVGLTVAGEEEGVASACVVRREGWHEVSVVTGTETGDRRASTLACPGVEQKEGSG